MGKRRQADNEDGERFGRDEWQRRVMEPYPNSFVTLRLRMNGDACVLVLHVKLVVPFYRTKTEHEVFFVAVNMGQFSKNQYCDS